MALDRRSVLKGAFAAGAAGAVGMTGAGPARASERAEAPPDAVGLLYDSTKCIGCKTCVVACQDANGLPRDTRQDPLHDAPIDLNDRAKTVIKLFRDDDDGRVAFFKAQCMHCIDPGCVNACMLGALQKREHGIVTWDPNRCIGCRYCQIACSFNVPKFQWESAAPKIIKCEMCNHRLAEGLEPACTTVCPASAVIFGKRADLLAEAKQRIADHPGRYQDHVYGETEGGGTQCLVLAPSNVDYTELGLPDLGDQPTAHLSRTVQHTVYKGFIAPVALYGLLGFVLWKNRRQEALGDGQGEGQSEEERS